MPSAKNETRIHWTGTSLTDPKNPVGSLPTKPGAFVDQARAKPISYGAAPTQNVVPAKMGQTIQPYIAYPSQGRRQVITTYGVGGRVIAGLASDLQASIYNFKPDICVIEILTNDFGGGTNTSPGGALQTSGATILDGVFQNLPGCQVVFLSVTVRGETVSGGHFADGTDTYAGNLRIQELCNGTASVGTFVSKYPSFCTYCDVITPALAYAVANNITASPTFLTSDSLHLSILGSVLASVQVMNKIQFN